MMTLPERPDAQAASAPETAEAIPLNPPLPKGADPSPVKGEGTATDGDPLPEFCHYRDEGCELATREMGRPSRCARCPFPDCIYSEPQGRRKWLKGLRDQAVIAGFLNDGKTVKELAGLFRISIRTVQRVLKGLKNG